MAKLTKQTAAFNHEKDIMTDALWGLCGVIIGGVIASVTTIIASRIENKRWLHEKKLEHLRLRISTLTPILTNGAAIIQAYEKGDRTGLPLEQGAEVILMITYMSVKSGMLWRDVIKAAKEQNDARHGIYEAWLASISNDIIEANSEIEELLK